MRRTSATLVAASTLALLPASAQAAPAWVAPADLAAATVTAPGVGAGPNGDVVVAWLRAGALEARFRGPGGDFGPTETLATGATSAAAATTPDGTGVVAWSQADGVWVAIHPSGGATAGAVRIAEAADPANVRIAGSPRGDLLVTYGAGGGAWAVYRTAGLAFDAPAGPFEGSTTCGVTGAIGADGDAAVGWRAADATGGCPATSAASVVRRAAGGSWTGPSTLGTTDALDLAVAAGGATAALRHAGSAVVADVAPRDGAFAEEPVGAATDPGRIAAGGTGFAVTWIGAARAQVRRLGGGAALPVSPAGASDAHVGMTGDGGMTVAWLRSGILEGARVAPDGTVTPADQPATAAGTDALRVAVDSDGNAYAVKVDDGALSGAALDAAGPRIDQLFVPLDGYAGEPVGFSMNPIDAWSALGATGFDLGDGTVAEGRSVTTTYASPGTRRITASATDARGNATAISRDVEIAPKRDRTAPEVSGFRIDDKAFRVARKATPTGLAAAARAPKGTRFRFTVSEAGHASILFEQLTRTKRGRFSYKPVGLITRPHEEAGRVVIPFTGRISASKGRIRVANVTLQPGAYRASVKAADASRNKSKAKRLKFYVVR